jgi:hypothetical protein
VSTDCAESILTDDSCAFDSHPALASACEAIGPDGSDFGRPWLNVPSWHVELLRRSTLAEQTRSVTTHLNVASVKQQACVHWVLMVGARSHRVVVIQRRASQQLGIGQSVAVHAAKYKDFNQKSLRSMITHARRNRAQQGCSRHTDTILSATRQVPIQRTQEPMLVRCSCVTPRIHLNDD